MIAVPILTSMQPAADGVDARRAHDRDLAHAGAVHRRGRDRRRGDLHAGQAREAGRRRTREHARRVARRGHDGRRSRSRHVAARGSIALTAVCLVIAGWLAFTFARSTVLAPSAVTLTLIAVPFVLIVGFLIAGVCGYMAGLIGASNSPISGVGILSIVICASMLVLAVAPTADTRQALVAFALFVTAIVFACATISNDNLQDLKTGQLVGASPMRQQIALIVGVAAGAAVIPPVLNLLAKAYGFAGAPNVDVVAPNPLPAPQATLISALAQGVIGGNLEWKMIGIGALVGVGLILLDATLGAMKKLRIPPLAVGIGIYLPMSATFAVIVGAVISPLVRRAHAHDAEPGARGAARARSSRRD